MNGRTRYGTPDLLDAIGADTALRRIGATSGGEFAGPCPICHDGDDRFRVWPNHPSGKGRFWCRVCGVKGDAIDYVRLRQGVSFREACDLLRFLPAAKPTRRPLSREPSLNAPNEAWKRRAAEFIADSEANLWGKVGQRALEYLRGHGLNDDTIHNARLGFNPTTGRESVATWGLSDRRGSVWLQSGIVIPYTVGGALWKVEIRRLSGEQPYRTVTGSAKPLYNADEVTRSTPVVLTEGVFDALTVEQEAGDLVAAVAAGSTHGARQLRWRMLLSKPPVVLVAFDADEAGDKAAEYWRRLLPNARRLRPYWRDVSDMARSGVEIRTWLLVGLRPFVAAS